MRKGTGQKSGHVGLDWGAYVQGLVAEHGTLSAVAWKLLAERGAGDDVNSVERAIRRLRGRGQRDGGVWGGRLLRRFGLPKGIEDRLMWMGLYHSLFNHLSVELCEDQLRLWDHPPTSESAGRVWIELGRGSVELRRRAWDRARALYRSVAALLATRHVRPEAHIEHAMMMAYLESRDGSDAKRVAALERARDLLASSTISAEDEACFRARLADEWGFRHNKAGRHEEAQACYRALPEADIHPFASYRRDAGLAYGLLRAGRHEEARARALAATTHAGDGGYTRLRVMGLILQARCEPPAAAMFLGRAEAIARRLQDEELIGRVERATRELKS